MSTLAEIKEAVDGLPPEERLELDAYIWATLRGVPVYESATIDDRMREMDQGDKVPWSSFRKEFLLREESGE